MQWPRRTHSALRSSLVPPLGSLVLRVGFLALVGCPLLFACSGGELFETGPDGDGPPRVVRLIDGGTDADRPAEDTGSSGEDSAPPVVPPPPQGCGSALEQDELVFTNQARDEAGVAPIACDPLMAAVARAHSQDMCDRTFFSHTDPEGGDPSDRMREGNVMFRGWGENIHRGSATAEGAHTSWMNSTGHRENILRSSFGRIGIGFVACSGGEYRNVWTQVFAN